MQRSYECHISSYYGIERRRYEFHCLSYSGGNSAISSTEDYFQRRLAQMPQVPIVITDYPRFPNSHDVVNINSVHEIEEDLKNPPIRVPLANQYHHQNHQKYRHQQQQTPPMVHKKVHFYGHEKGANGGKQDVYDDQERANVDVEADRFIRQKRRNFDLWNSWDNSKAY